MCCASAGVIVRVELGCLSLWSCIHVIVNPLACIMQNTIVSMLCFRNRLMLAYTCHLCASLLYNEDTLELAVVEKMHRAVPAMLWMLITLQDVSLAGLYRNKIRQSHQAISLRKLQHVV